MATAVISGRVDERIKERADAYLRAAGLQAGDVIRQVWEHIARTGEIPIDGKREATVEEDPFEKLAALRISFGSSEELKHLTDEQMRDIIASRYA